ncbi:MAG: thioredoxin family protein [Prevotella sp.]|nr:thioredoxin family protein [Prevotella sp.]MCM1075191.1 thioredoxin family protein [Ruminococcus sp.]
MKKTYFLLLAMLIGVFALKAATPPTWSYKIIDEDTDHPAIQMTATIAPGHHLYNFDHKGLENPIAFSIRPTGATLIGSPTPDRAPVAEVDEDGMQARFFTGSVTYTQKFKPTKDIYSFTIKITGQACDDSSCANFNAAKKLTGKAKLAGDDKKDEKADEAATEAADNESAAEAEEVAAEMEAQASEAEAGDAAAVAANVAVGDEALWRNVEKEVKALGDEKEEENTSLLGIFLAGLLGGIIALITPCVWPMIPMTVSFFLKQNKSRAKSIRAASIYGASIIVIYVLLGLLVTAIFGATALNALSTNAWFNVFFFLLLVVFAISFMGGFEITLPSKFTNKMDSKVDSSTGLLSIFFMAFTLALVSFSCTGPIIGTLLVEAATSGSYLAPAVGMLGFAFALALPFTLFAMFPTMLKSMPKSGGWLNTVKVVLGFLELALALKFLSIADLTQGWRILDREVFICLWIVIFALLGVYLLGKLRFPHDSKVEKTGVGRFMLALISLSFAVYMIPGLWGAPLKAISAFAPPSYTQDFSLYDGEVHSDSNSFEEGVNKAIADGKPILLDFSGYGCTNCRELEGAVWTNNDVRDLIKDKFVLVSLMVDDKAKLPEPIEKTNSKGELVILETVGELWGYLESEKFGIAAQPYHVIIDHDGTPLSGSMDYQNGKDVDVYLNFLNTGLENFNKKHSAPTQE